MQAEHRNLTWLSLTQMIALFLGAFALSNTSMWLESAYGNTKAFTLAQALSFSAEILSLALIVTFVSRFEKEKTYPTANRFKIGFIFAILLVTSAFGSTAVGLVQVLPVCDTWIGFMAVVSVVISALYGVLEGCL